VRAAGEEWDLGIARAAAFLAALVCGAFAALLLARPAPALPRWTGIALGSWSACCSRRRRRCFSSGSATRPRRGSSRTTRPTKAELGGDLVLHLDNPYGHDYNALRPGALLHTRRHGLAACPRQRGLR
jgi:hypothetical protein